MKVLLAICLALISIDLQAQSLSIFDIDTTNFPTMKAKFFAFDKDGNQIINLTKTDLEITEDGIQRNILNLSCPIPEPIKALSSVLVMDASGSMLQENLTLAKVAAKAWIEALPLGKSECAITAFDIKNYLLQDFTTDKNSLLAATDSLFAIGGTNYDAAFIDPMASGLNITKQGKHKRVIIFLSDGFPNQDPQTAQIIAEAKKQNVTIYAVTLGLSCPRLLKVIAKETGGLWFENVTTVEQAIKVYHQILNTAQGSSGCSIEWESTTSCNSGLVNVELSIKNLGLIGKTIYQKPKSSIAKLAFSPTAIRFSNPQIGKLKSEKLIVTAMNANYSVTNIKSTNAGFDINPKKFILDDGQSKELTVTYLAADSGFNFCEFQFENSICPLKLYASGGWKGIVPTIRTLKLIQPNGGEIFVAGSDTIITWEGVSPNEIVKLEYRTDDSQPWITITDSAKGLKHPFKVPNIVSKKYLARVTAKLQVNYCNNSDVNLCGQVWMACNLEVDTYRNGDPIRHAITVDDWIEAGNNEEGAWCYYDNDPSNHEIYGKLYNWFAVNDSRGLAPEGWHIPTQMEWKILSDNCLRINPGRKMKSTGTIKNGDGLWQFPNEATNESGFSGLPGGFRHINGDFHDINNTGCWWSSDLKYGIVPVYYCLYYKGDDLYEMMNNFKNIGVSVRCVKDK